MMNGTSDIGTAKTYGDEGGLDPREAARLLDRSTRQAQRGLDFRSPGLSLLAAALVLIAFGSVWLSVRGQHPCKWPTPVGLAGLYVVIAIRIGSVIYAHHRARAGVSRRSVRRRQAESAALAVALIVVYVVMIALAVAGARDGVAYGVDVATATRHLRSGLRRRPRGLGRAGDFDADYLTSDKTGSGPASRTSLALTHRGRAALDAYTETLRTLLNGL
jgi:hypothetical protein